MIGVMLRDGLAIHGNDFKRLTLKLKVEIAIRGSIHKTPKLALTRSDFNLRPHGSVHRKDFFWRLGLSAASIRPELNALYQIGRPRAPSNGTATHNQDLFWHPSEFRVIGFDSFDHQRAGHAVQHLLVALAMRVNYVGELGWELHVPSEHLPAVHERLVAAGREFALAHFGLYAMESLRLEKCYRSWKADLTTEYTPFMASLERFVRLDKAADFIGRQALRKAAAAGPKERFVPLLVDAQDADAAAVSIVYRGTEAVGLITSGGYGYRLNRSIALAYVRTDLSVPGTELEVEILGERRRAVVAATRAGHRRTRPFGSRLALLHGTNSRNARQSRSRTHRSATGGRPERRGQ